MVEMIFGILLCVFLLCCVLLPLPLFYWSYRQKKYYNQHPEEAQKIILKYKNRREQLDKIIGNLEPLKPLFYILLLVFAVYFIVQNSDIHNFYEFKLAIINFYNKVIDKIINFFQLLKIIH